MHYFAPVRAAKYSILNSTPRSRKKHMPARSELRDLPVDQANVGV